MRKGTTVQKRSVIKIGVKDKGKADGKYVSTECKEKLAELIKTMKAEIAEMKKAKMA